MEDYLIREIDRIGEMLLQVAQRLGLFTGSVPHYSVSDINAEMERVKLSLDVNSTLNKENPLLYLVESEKLSDTALETFVEIVAYSDIDPSKKAKLIEDTKQYFAAKGYFSFKLHSL